MVVDSPYKKALSMTGLGTVMGIIFFLSGLSQLATLPRPNWILVILGFLMMVVFGSIFRWVEKHGKKHLSTTGYIGGRPFEDVSFFSEFQ